MNDFFATLRTNRKLAFGLVVVVALVLGGTASALLIHAHHSDVVTRQATAKKQAAAKLEQAHVAPDSDHSSQNVAAIAAPRTANPPATVTVAVSDDGFLPAAVYVASGATITWTNTGKQPHQINPSLQPYVPASSQPLAAMQSPVLQPGQSFSYTITYDMTQTGSAGYYDGKVPSHQADITVAQP